MQSDCSNNVTTQYFSKFQEEYQIPSGAGHPNDNKASVNTLPMNNDSWLSAYRKKGIQTQKFNFYN